MQNLKEILKNKIDEMTSSTLNNDQKKLAKRMLDFAPLEELNNWYKLIIQRVKLGFTFDAAPEIFEGAISIVKEQKEFNLNIGETVDDRENKLIIGENYEALKNLLLVFKNKIDFIYIDPPYNTKNMRTYKDKYLRTGWLNMMNERLKLAKDLLSDEGIIFVSVDDNEQAYLKVLMDEIFDEKNFVGVISWQSSFGGKNDSKQMAINTEYILVYSFSEKFNKVLKLSKNNSNFNKMDDKFEQFGGYKLRPLYWASLEWHKSLDFKVFVIKEQNKFKPVFTNSKDVVGTIVAGPAGMTMKEKMKLREQRIQGNHNHNDWCFYWSKDVIKCAFEAGFIEIKKNKNGEFGIYQKEYEKAKYDGRKKEVKIFGERKYVFRNIISDPKNITSKIGNEETESIFGFKLIDYPKPVSLITYLLELSNKNSIVLDFFAGTGTTGHAVMEMNRKDNGNRTFILVDEFHNSNKIIKKEMSYEKLHRIIKGETTEGKKDFSWIEKNEPFFKEKLRVFTLKKYPVSFQDDPEPYIDIAKKELSKLNSSYDTKEEIDIYSDLNSLHPLILKEDK